METSERSAGECRTVPWPAVHPALRLGALAPPAGAPRSLAVAWSLPGEEPARSTYAPGQPTLAFPGPPGESALPSLRRLAGWPRFRQLELVGSGGMGRVYRARDRNLRRRVAVKLLVAGRPSGDELREARLQARVDHPAVLPVLDHGWLGELPWFSMPYLGAATLAAAGPTLSPRDGVRVVRDLCRVVAAVHRAGVVHCDVNPRNVIVDRRGGRLRSWLIDFGIAEEVGSRRPRHTAFGTPASMAPEQMTAGGADLDPRTDVYGLGATLFQVVTGRQPFSATTCGPVADRGVQPLIERVLHDQPPALPPLAPDAPPGLERVVRRCLAKEPAERYPSAGALGDELARITGR